MHAIKLSEAQKSKADQLTQYRAEIDAMAAEIIGELNSRIAEQPFLGDWRAKRIADSSNNLIVKYAMAKAALPFSESGEYSTTLHCNYAEGLPGDRSTKYFFSVAVSSKQGTIPEVLLP